MTITFDKPPIVDLRPPTVPTHDPGATTMEIVPTDDNPRAPPQYSGPAPPMHRIPPPEAPHGLPAASGLYDQSWRQFPPSYDGHPPESRRTSNLPQPPLPSHNYPPMQSRERPQPPPDAPFGRPASLPTPAHAPSEPLPPPHANFHPMNGVPHESSPLSAPPDFARARMSFPPQDPPPHTNGDPPPPPNSLPPAPYPPTVPSVSHTPVPYDSSYYQSQSFNMRNRRATRAQQACDQCRARKAKCDEGRPACSHCKENNLICVYKEVPPHKQEKSTQHLVDRIQLSDDTNESRFSHLENLHLGHDKLLDQGLAKLDQILAKLDWIAGNDIQKQPQLTPMKPYPPETSQKSEAKEQTVPDEHKAGDPSSYTNGLLQIGDSEDGELSIPVEHTTAAHKLLGWPSITKLLQPHRYDDDYVMKLEENREFMRLDGRGDRVDLLEESTSQATSFNTSLEEGYSEVAAINSSWPNTRYNDTPPEIKGIDENGVVSLEAGTVRRYRNSYLDNLHKLHPFLNQQDLERKTETFIEMYCPKPGQTTHISRSKNSIEAPRGAKRKRSGETLQPSPSSGKPDSAAPRPVEKTLSNAIILLVLALGRICEVRDDPIRGPCTDRIIDYRDEPIPGVPPHGALPPHEPDLLPPPQGSFYSPYQNHSPSTVPAPDDKYITLPDPPHLQNVDTVPGLALYAYATQILAGKNLTHLSYVQAALLAGLYTGQLAHPFKSAAWISQAARVCQLLTSPKRYADLPEGHSKDLLNFAYWTCLQLESDILAELDLPASGISRSESRINLPKGQFTISLPNDISAPNTMMMFFYSAQIHLRKVLNRVHTDLYKVEKQGETRWSTNVQEILSMNLNLWRSSLPKEMKWHDKDPPSTDINVARMRAKYYGARYIIHRPLLYHALHYCGPKADPGSVDSPTGFGESASKSQKVSPAYDQQQASVMTRIQSDLGNNQGTNVSRYRDLPQRLRISCKLCVDSAILSTEAFDRVEGRPVVTNIFGTAHAQFGNMLVLSTTYMSPHLSEIVDRNVLERLLRRTIVFLLRNRNISPSLRADAKILTDIYVKIFGDPPVLSGID
ncbi:putative C6 finger domain protein [Aspergillus lucknowensis]|uniref:Zn(2)-C6 fungal-type domain-containing protein n=1 Tax=Aspergillus lucknowensis TaxID=176173 RepID=A0ABR4M6P5_9EURO